MAIQDRDRFVEFSNLIYSASKSLLHLKTKGMEAYGLGSTHTFCLRSLHGSKNGLTRTELARACEVDKAQISRLVAELIDGGYILESSKGAGYRKKLILTDMGRDVAEGIGQKVERVLQYVSGEIPEDALETMYTTLGLICEKLKCVDESILSLDEACSAPSNCAE